MTISPLAGQPAAASMLVNVSRLVSAYYAEHPDVAVAAERVAFGTSGHRGSAFARTFNEAHILAITQAICNYRASHGITGPLFLGIDTHALSEPAAISALEVLAANDIDVMIDRDRGYTPTPVISHAILRYNHGRTSGLADGIVITPSHNPPEDGGFKYNPTHGGPAGTDVTSSIENTANALLADALRGVRRMPHARALRASTTHLHDYIAPYSDDLGTVIDMAAIRGAGVRIGIDPLGGAGVHYWGRIIERYAHRRHDRQRPRRSDVRLHERRLGRQNPDGLLIAVCDGAARRDARSFRRRLRERCRPRPPRHRDANGGTDEPQSLSGGDDFVSVHAPARVVDSSCGR